MPAAVESMFSVKEVPWHGLGKILENSPKNAEEAVVESGLNWPVGLIDLQTVDGFPVESRATYREIDGQREILGVVGQNYTVLQNLDAFKWFDPFVESGDCEYATAGSLYEGKRVWVLAHLKREPLTITLDDTVEKFLLLAHSHDGSLSIFTGYTPIRVVCANTLGAALAKGAGNKLVKIRHTSSASVKLDNIRDTINGIDKEFNEQGDKYRFLATHPVNSAERLADYFKTVLEVKPNAEGKIATRSQNRLNELASKFETGIGNDLPGVKGSWWAAYNAITENLSYDAGRNANNRMASLWFGPNAELNRKALSQALVMAS